MEYRVMYADAYDVETIEEFDTRKEAETFINIESTQMEMNDISGHLYIEEISTSKFNREEMEMILSMCREYLESPEIKLNLREECYIEDIKIKIESELNSIPIPKGGDRK